MKRKKLEIKNLMSEKETIGKNIYNTINLVFYTFIAMLYFLLLVFSTLLRLFKLV
jgi:hypothetical protein